MKAVWCEAFAAIDQLKIADIPAPELKPGHVLIDVYAAGMNFPDGLIVQGKYQTKPPLPFAPGSEAAGMVAAIGEGVTGFKKGDRVVAFSGLGGFAEQAVIPATQVYHAPEGVSFEALAGLLINFGTSYHALKDKAAIQPGETLLVLGAAGGVGLSAVELGARMGAKVIAAASSAEKLQLAKSRGATELIDYTKENLRDRIKEITGGKGVDVVYDPVGGESTLATIKSLAWGGRHLVIGFAAGDIPNIPANLLLLKSASSMGVLWGMSLRADPVHHGKNIAQLLQWLAEGQITPEIDRVFPLEEVIPALEHVMERRARGKVILSVRPS